MGRNTLEVEQLKRSAEKRGAGPVVYLDGPPSVTREGCFELWNDTKRAIHDLGCERSVGAAQGSPAKLGVQRGGSPRVVVNDAVQNASRKFSSRRNHGRTLAWVTRGGTEIGGPASA